MSFARAAGCTRRGARPGPHDEEAKVTNVATTDVTVVTIDEMEAIHGGLARRARATLGVSGWGMQVLTLPPEWDGYPEHNHDATAFDPNQEEVYVPLSGSATLVAGGERFDLVPGVMARVGPEQHRRILPGSEGIRMVVLGGRPGAFDAPAWTELGAPPPTAE
jgi:mannose-6-phosphate isomerase-like protein (cupin superfamily)